MNAATMNSFDWKRAVGVAVAALVALVGLWLVSAIYSAGQPMLAVGALVLFAAGLYLYVSRTALAWRYLFPGIVGMLLFVAFPLVYTMWIGFTNYSSTHLLSQARVKAYLLEQTVPDEDHSLEFTLHPDGDGLRRGSSATIFTVARIAGIVAHALEEYEYRLRFRPRASYVGPAPPPAG